MKINKIFISTLMGALLITPLFQTYAQPSEAAKSALQEIVEIKEVSDTVEARKAALAKVLEFSALEIKDLKKQLSNIRNLDVDYIKLRDELLNTLDKYLAYLDAINQRLQNENFTLDSIKNLANEFKDWRENQYNPEIKAVVNFILVFQEKLILKTVTSRFEKISGDINRLKNSKLIKIDLLRPLLNEAAGYLKEAQLLNDQAQNLLIGEAPDQSQIQILIENSFNKIKATYKSFFKMGALVKEMLGL